MSKMAYFSQMFVDADQRDASMTLNRLLKVDTVQLPESESTVKLCNDFANFFNNKIETIRGKIAERVKGEDLITPSSGPVAAPPPLSELRPTDRVELTKIIMKSPNKTCSLDVLPTTLLKQTLDIQIPTLVNIINMSFASGSFPRQLKTAVVKPLLKRPSLDKNNLQNYRPSFQPCLHWQGNGEGGSKETGRPSGDARLGRKTTVSIPSQPLHGDCPHEDP